MPGADVLAAVGEHEQQPARGERAHRELHGGEARPVDPVEVFDHDDDGTLARGRLEQQGDRLVQLGRAGSADGAGSEPPSGVSSVSAARAGPAASRANSSPSAPTTARSTDVIGACGAETSPR